MEDIGWALLYAIVFAVPGRIILSFMPPGRPGYHELHELPLTWATSYLVGACSLSTFGWLVTPWVLLLLTLIAALVRWLTLPGGMVPRYELRGHGGGRMTALLGLAVLAIVLWPRDWNGRVPGTPSVAAMPLSPEMLLALIIVLAHGLASARRARWAAYVWLIVLAIVLGRSFARLGILDLFSVWIGAGAAFAVAWLRRAERRARALAILFFAVPALSSSSGALLSLACLCGLAAATARPSRTPTIVLGVSCLAAFALAGIAAVQRAWSHPSAFDLLDHRVIATLAAVVGGIAAIALRGVLERGRSTTAMIDGRRREIIGIGLALALGLIAAAIHPFVPWSAPTLVDRWFPTPLLQLVPIAGLWLGLVALPAENPLPRR